MSLLVEKKHRVLHITLNRPAKRNALTADMCERITDAVNTAQTDDNTGCILITANGPMFCSGMDLDEAVAPEGQHMTIIHEQLFTMGFQSLKPIVIAVNGAAMGGGVGLVAQGHVVVAERSSVFCLPEVRLGLWPFLVYRAMETALGSRRVLPLSLTGRTFSAEEALAWGLVHQVVHDDEANDRGAVVARELARACPAAIQAGMQYTRDARGKSTYEAGLIAASLRDKLMASADFEEGCAARKARREPRWASMPAEFYERAVKK